MARKNNDVSLVPGNMASLISITAMTLLWLWVNDTYLHIDGNQINAWQWWVVPVIASSAIITTATGFIIGVMAQHMFGKKVLNMRARRRRKQKQPKPITVVVSGREA